MAKEVTVIPAKTYATHANARAAVEKLYKDADDLRFLIVNNSAGRFYPLFLGPEALQRQVHFNFCVVF